MDIQLSLLVLLAALLHAFWNTLVKSSDDSLAQLALLNFFSALLAISAIPWVGIPDPASWIYILASTIIHTGYYILLLQAYRFGDLSHVYPLARGVAPLVVASLSVVFTDEFLNIGQLSGVLLISASVTSLAWHRGGPRRGRLKSVLFALGTGCMIGGYTIIDGSGVRLSGNALAYIAWLFAVDWIPIAIIAIFLRRHTLSQAVNNQWRSSCLGGVLAIGAYGLVIWALSLGAMALVAALRETSVVIAAVIGTVFLGEPFGRRRIVAAFGVTAGIIVLRLAV